MSTKQDATQPKRYKVAIIGKAPSSRMIAPYDQPETWEIWSISDNYNVIPRWDRWFELHELDRYKELYTEYYDWMSALPAGDKPLYVTDTWHDLPAAVPFPWQAIVHKYGHYFTNSISWLICFAIEEITQAIQRETGKAHVGPEDYRAFGAAIGLWGVDMATASEYEHQRPSCEWFMGWAKGLGIELVVPDECDLVKTARLYAVEGFRGTLDKKIRVRDHELSQRLAKMEADSKQAEFAVFAGGGAHQEVSRLAEALAQHHPELAQQLAQRAEQLASEQQQAQQAMQVMHRNIHMLQGAKEDLKWCRQFA